MGFRTLLLTSALALPALLLVQGASRGGKAAPPPQRATAAPTTPSFRQHVAPLLAHYCTKCHGGARPKGDMALDRYKDEQAALKQKELWERVAANLRSGDMPPPGKPRPSPEEVETITRWIDRAVHVVDCTLPRDPGQATLRRLNRAEYNNTLRDLLGIQFRPADDFPSDDVGYGFDNIGDVLSLSPLLLEKYLAAAEKAVDLTFRDPEARKRLLLTPLTGPNKTEAARTILKSFARRAYRRPVSPQEVDRLLRFVELAQKDGESIEQGVRLAIQAALVSPHFLFRVEQDRKVVGPARGHPVSEYELASRLSYFLWSSMPDEELFQLAADGALRKGDNLERQVKRMLADAKARALVDNFFGQWLQLRNLTTVTPDPGRYPTFSETLRAAMRQETELFVEAVIKEDRSVLDFLSADFTFVNERLARHYGMKGIKGDEFRKVPAPQGRGGILTQASVLTLTSNPTRTSPVKRGKWILETILNTPPPPPPPDVPELEGDGKELKGSLRQRMELHRAKAICASCHQRMDPLGFGLENFDGIGAWRDRDGTFPVDATGTLPGGQEFNGARGLREILLRKEADFRRCLAEKMLTYALGRGLEAYDRCAVDDIAAAVGRSGNRCSALVLAIVQSEPFQMRRGKR